MNEDLITTLLHQAEGETLDFKRDQYALTGADNATKAELIKDILAFANAWKASDAYILIGVQENPSSGKATVVGVATHLNDADLQQLVNSKTNRPVKFNYRALDIDGKSIGVITILAEQDRPLYLIKDFGGLKSGVVKIRRGSSTTDANPDEISEMGAAKITRSKLTPRVEFEFANVQTKVRLGHEIVVHSVRLLNPPPPPLPIAEHTSDAHGQINAIPCQFLEPIESFRSALFPKQKEPTAEDRFRWTQEKSKMFAVGFWARNAGDQLLADVIVVIKGPKHAEVVVWDDTTHPDDETHMPFGGGSFRMPTTADVNFDEHGESWTINVEFGKLQPKSESFSRNVLYIGAIVPANLILEAEVFSDHLSNPIRFGLAIEIDPVDVDYQTVQEWDLDNCRCVSFAVTSSPRS